MPPRVWAGLAIALAAVPRADSGPSQQHTLRLHYTPKQQQVGRYQHVPFEVPAGTTRLEIAYRYDKAGGANVVDLGLFEPGPLDLGTPAFRGWSGGERAEISVGTDTATPGYWPGPIPAGRWHVMLGLYKVSEAGVDLELDITTSAGPAGPPPSLAARAQEPIRRGEAWYSGALHVHTLHSDGALAPLELAERARREGLDFIAITDHNNTTHQLETIQVPGLLVITGEEVTTPGGHVNAWGLGGPRDVVDFRVLPGEPGLADLMDAARRRGVLFSINHPRSACVACSWTHDIPDAVTAMEVVNVRHEELAQSIAVWDSLLRQGRRMVGIGTSDWHRGSAPIGAASVRVHARDLSTNAILAAIQAGRVVVMADAVTPPPELVLRAAGREARVGESLELRRDERLEVEVSALGPAFDGARVDLIWRGELIASAQLPGGAPLRFERFAQAPGYFRAHVTTADGRPLGMTNPVWVRVTP